MGSDQSSPPKIVPPFGGNSSSTSGTDSFVGDCRIEPVPSSPWISLSAVTHRNSFRRISPYRQGSAQSTGSDDVSTPPLPPRSPSLSNIPVQPAPKCNVFLSPTGDQLFFQFPYTTILYCAHVSSVTTRPYIHELRYSMERDDTPTTTTDDRLELTHLNGLSLPPLLPLTPSSQKNSATKSEDGGRHLHLEETPYSPSGLRSTAGSGVSNQVISEATYETRKPLTSTTIDVDMSASIEIPKGVPVSMEWSDPSSAFLVHEHITPRKGSRGIMRKLRRTRSDKKTFHDIRIRELNFPIPPNDDNEAEDEEMIFASDLDDQKESTPTTATMRLEFIPTYLFLWSIKNERLISISLTQSPTQQAYFLNPSSDDPHVPINHFNNLGDFVIHKQLRSLRWVIATYTSGYSRYLHVFEWNYSNDTSVGIELPASGRYSSSLSLKRHSASATTQRMGAPEFSDVFRSGRSKEGQMQHVDAIELPHRNGCLIAFDEWKRNNGHSLVIASLLPEQHDTPDDTLLPFSPTTTEQPSLSAFDFASTTRSATGFASIQMHHSSGRDSPTHSSTSDTRNTDHQSQPTKYVLRILYEFDFKPLLALNLSFVWWTPNLLVFKINDIEEDRHDLFGIDLSCETFGRNEKTKTRRRRRYSSSNKGIAMYENALLPFFEDVRNVVEEILSYLQLYLIRRHVLSKYLRDGMKINGIWCDQIGRTFVCEIRDDKPFKEDTFLMVNQVYSVDDMFDSCIDYSAIFSNVSVKDG